jgi:hypothetical protein
MNNEPIVHTALGSATAGIVSRLFTHPLDTAKARLQAPTVASVNSGSSAPKTYHGVVDVLTKTFRKEGIRGWYRGFGAVIVGGTPGTMLYLCSYEIAKERLSSTKKDFSGELMVHFSSGMLAEAIACIVYVPVDVIKERLQVQRSITLAEGSVAGSNHYNGGMDALKKILRTEGLSGIYKGYGATMASFGPFSAIYFSLYEQFKGTTRQYLRRNSTSRDTTDPIEMEEIPFPHLVACSATSGAIASWLTSPLDMAKLRLQIQRGNLASHGPNAPSNSATSYNGMIDCLRTVFRQGGIRGLWVGAGARVLHFAPATTITMVSYERCRDYFATTLSTKHG